MMTCMMMILIAEILLIKVDSKTFQENLCHGYTKVVLHVV